MIFINNPSICRPYRTAYLFCVQKRSLAPFHPANSLPPQNCGCRMTQGDWSPLLFFLYVLHFSEECDTRSINHKMLMCRSTWDAKSWIWLLLRPACFAKLQEDGCGSCASPRGAVRRVEQPAWLPMLMLFNANVVLLFFTIILLYVAMNQIQAATCTHTCRKCAAKLFSSVF